MVIPDVNVLVYAFRSDVPDHHRYLAWLEALVNSDQTYALPNSVLSGFLRVVTHPRAFAYPSPLDSALAFAGQIRGAAGCVPVAPGARHWDIFSGLCQRAQVRGNLVPDAYLAALAIESGSEFITTDRDFARFPGLRWRHPFDPQ